MGASLLALTKSIFYKFSVTVVVNEREMQVLFCYDLSRL